MSVNLFEGFDYHDLVNQIDPIVTVDEYVAKTGSDDEMLTLTFTIKGEQAGKDLSDWFSRGYEYIILAQVSKGEISPGKYLVFVEMERRTRVPERIVELLTDLETLTDIPCKDWTVTVEGEDYDPDVAQLKKCIILSPKEYREEKEVDLNEMRTISGIKTHNIYEKEKDSILKNYISKAGL